MASYSKYSSSKAEADSKKIYNMNDYHYSKYVAPFEKQFVNKDKKQVQGIDYSKLLSYLDDNDVTKNETCYEGLCILSKLEEHVVLKLKENNKILPLLLAHAGVFANCATRRRIFTRYNLPSDGKYSFWSRCIPDNVTRRFLCECYIPLYEKKTRCVKQKPKKRLGGRQEQPPCCALCPCEGKGLDVLLDEKEKGYFSPDWQMRGNCPPNADMEQLAHKMILIVDTLRNISVDKENAAVLAKNVQFLRYLLLSLKCSLSYVRSNALEILCNVSPFMSVAEYEKHPLIYNFIKFVADGIREKSKFLQMKCFMTLGGWYSIQEKPSKRASQMNYSSLAKFEALDLHCVSEALHNYISTEDIISVSLIVDLLSNISLHGKRGCEELCKNENMLKSLVALCTHDLVYDWQTWQRFSSLENYTPRRNMEDLFAAGVEKTGTNVLSTVPKTITTQTIYSSTNYTIVEGAAGSRPLIVDLIPNMESKLGNIPQGFGRFSKKLFSDATARDFGMTFEHLEEKLRLTACNTLKDIATCSATGRRMILQYDTRLFMQGMRGSIHNKYILDILTALGSKYAGINKK